MHWILDRYVNQAVSGGSGRKQPRGTKIDHKGFDAQQRVWVHEEIPKIQAAQADRKLSERIYLLSEVRDLAPPAASEPPATAAAAAAAGISAAAAAAAAAGTPQAAAPVTGTEDVVP